MASGFSTTTVVVAGDGGGGGCFAGVCATAAVDEAERTSAAVAHATRRPFKLSPMLPPKLGSSVAVRLRSRLRNSRLV